MRDILGLIERNQLYEYIHEQQFLNDPIIHGDTELLLGHVEILLDAGIVRHAEVERGPGGKFVYWDLRGAYITMQGHDLLDALRDRTVWQKIESMAQRAGVALSWEFIKAAVPLAIKEIAVRALKPF